MKPKSAFKTSFHTSPAVLFVAALGLCTSLSCASDTPPLTPAQQNAVSRSDPQMKAVLAAHASLLPKPLETLTPAEARRQPSPADAVVKLMQDQGTAPSEPMPAMGKIEMREVPGPEGATIPVRVYTPQGQGPFPGIVYYHGGGWVIATLDTYDASCRSLADLTGAVVVSVDYRQAPEHKFPAAHEDSYAALQHVMNNASEYGVDPARIAVAGESAGGNLATAVCLISAERGGKMPVHQALVYPIANYAFDTESYQENAQTVPLNKPAMMWFFEHYLTSPADGENVLISPLRASDEQLKALPPATLVTAEIDPLRSEGMAYAERLKGAGVDVASRDYEGVTHEFFGMAAVVDKAKEAQQFVADRIKQAF